MSSGMPSVATRSSPKHVRLIRNSIQHGRNYAVRKPGRHWGRGAFPSVTACAEADR